MSGSSTSQAKRDFPIFQARGSGGDEAADRAIVTTRSAASYLTPGHRAEDGFDANEG
jgi:hypothetical protein